VVAGSGISVSNNGVGVYTVSTIPVSLSVLDAVMSANTISIAYSGGGQTTNGWDLGTYTYDFINYEYDITIDIDQRNYVGFAHLHWGWNSDYDQTHYRQNWNDHDGANFFGTGTNPDAKLIYLHSETNIHHHLKMRLRELRTNQFNSMNSALLLEYMCSYEIRNANSQVFPSNHRFSRGFSLYASPTFGNGSMNGLKQFAIYTQVTNYASQSVGSPNACYARISRIPIK
jgi:hypothetical protein